MTQLKIFMTVLFATATIIGIAAIIAIAIAKTAWVLFPIAVLCCAITAYLLDKKE